MTPNSDSYVGKESATSTANEFNAQTFVIKQILSGRNFAALVQVKSVTNAGGLSTSGTVNVLPLVNQVDGNNRPMPHGVVIGLPYMRLQGGANAIILDPQVGDIGLAIFADRDISSVKSKKGQANPGSSRRGSMSDGLYVGGFLNGLPTQYVQFNAAGISVVSPVAVTITAPAINSTGTWNHTGTLMASVDVIGGGKSLKTHIHSGVAAGSANTGAPV